jgi:hypothetical protein
MFPIEETSTQTIIRALMLGRASSRIMEYEQEPQIHTQVSHLLLQ